jgi:predicted Zn-dependent protease
MTESDLLPRSRCLRILDEAQTTARSMGVSQVEVTLQNERMALTRFANNAIHQNVAELSGSISIRVQDGHRTARATVNGWTRDSVDRAVSDAVALARLQPEDPDLAEMAGPRQIVPVARHFQSTAGLDPFDAAECVKPAVTLAESMGMTAAGIFSASESALAILNTNGVFAYHSETMSQFSITVMGADSSGWAKQSDCDVSRLDFAQLAQRAVEKAVRSAAPRDLPPGKYTVILEPAAVLDLVGQIFPDFSVTSLNDERSFLTERLGTQLFGPHIRILDDAYHPEQAGPPFDAEGVPRQMLELVRAGVPSQVAYSRNAALKLGAEPTGHGLPLPNEFGEAVGNLVIGGGDRTIGQMMASAGRAILVTRLWYIREVDPYEKLMTGMTRDGTFLVEDGAIVHGVRNFRFNESVVGMLNRVESMSPPARASGEEAPDMVVPAMLVRDFPFTEVTKF